jgi:hypothetical protein
MADGSSALGLGGRIRGRRVWVELDIIARA